MRPASCAFVALALFVALPRAAQASWPHDPFNGNLPVSTATNYQYTPDVASDGAGGIFVAWQDLRGGNVDIYAQHISAAGVALWTVNGVAACVAAGAQYSPQIEPDGAGGAILTWYDERSGAVAFDIYAQKLNSLGAPQWGLGGVAVCTAANAQYSPRLVTDGSGGAIVTWYDLRGADRDIYAQRVTSVGATLWATNGVALCTAAGDQSVPMIVADGAGGAFVAWEDLRSGAIDIYAQRVSGVGVPGWAANGVAVCSAVGDQSQVAMAGDGASGAIVAWRDRRGADDDIYAQRVTFFGTTQWAANGVALCAAAGNQSLPVIAADGSSGAVATWQDYRNGVDPDLYVQRVSGAGATQWTANGVAVCVATGAQSSPSIASDGLGGALIGWEDNRGSAGTDVYAQRVTSAGSISWTSNGAVVSAASYNQVKVGIAPDGSGGAVLAWDDGRSNLSNDIYAQRIERFGQLGNPEPAITAVKDVVNDQGGWVKVSWNASYLDVEPTFGIFDYRVWRSVPTSALTAGALLARGMSADPDDAATGGRLLAMPLAGQDYAWELVGTQGAAILPSYSLVTPTTGDSIGGSNPRTAFMVEARQSTSVSADRWFSAPDSGYSVDNLAPIAPAPFTAQYSGGTTALHWNPNHESDLAGYRLYRGASTGFVPGPGNLVSAQGDTGYVDAAGAPWVYKLTAVDVHGNESLVAIVVPSGTTAVGDGAPAHAFFAIASANPVRAGAATTLRFGLAARGRASLALYDAGGRRVRELAAGPREPGEYALAWDGRDDAGRAVAPGLYFARLETPGFAATRKLVVQN